MNNPPLYALLLIGGYSRRMGRDKSLLDYHGKPQWEHNMGLFEGLVDKIYISVRKGQTVNYPNLLEDKYDNIGPLGAILTAMETFPNTAFLVFATDIPFLNLENLKHLISNRDRDFMATAFKGTHKDYPEPLACIWEPELLPKLQEQFKNQNYKSLYSLNNSNIKTIPIEDVYIQNINTTEEYLNCKKDKTKKIS